ncbi:5-carboxyvanillate decarboxylase [Fusarium mexicanum]|uniref:5-carboxyvanillate decarboxylase n=1 Tax=Fusarium mexicanum TaxID=751941 RepID=A0A8H5JE87_9HYPO|nr:5-carboxyvanillate decarboxylase [Fusarium mexicanum]
MSESSESGPKYRIRPGTFFDVPATTRIYAASFGNEPLIDFFFPTRRQDPVSFYTWSCRRFQRRYWTPGYSLSVVVDKHDHPVGLSWWKRPTQPLTLLQKLLSPSFWVGSVINAFINMQEYLFPVQGLNKNNMETFEQAFSDVEPHALDTPQRQKAHYLSLLGVDPVLQGEGLGKMLLEDGLEKVDDEDSAAWLVSLAGLEKFYARYGFVEVTKVEVEGLHDWKGGMVMAAHSSTAATDDPIHGFPDSIINKLVDFDDERIKNMDENNIAIQVLSHTPTNFVTAETIIACNDELVAAVRANKSRFAGFACLPMGDPVAATNELERCIKEHSFVGALVDNHFNGNFYDGREYDIVWAKAVELDVPIYIHPAWPSQKENEALYSGGNLQLDSNSATALGAFAFGWHASTANTILRLMASNTFDRHPKLKIIIGHSGELIPYMFDRICKATAFFGMERGFVEVMHNNIWITTSGMFDVHSLRCLLGNMPLSQVMFSVDYPFSDNKLGKGYLEMIRREGILDEGGIEAFTSGNARRLLFCQG